MFSPGSSTTHFWAEPPQNGQGNNSFGWVLMSVLLWFDAMQELGLRRALSWVAVAVNSATLLRQQNRRARLRQKPYALWARHAMLGSCFRPGVLDVAAQVSVVAAHVSPSSLLWG